MRSKINPIEQLVKDAINNGKPLTVKEIKTLRAESQKASTIFKSIFWGGIVIFNLLTGLCFRFFAIAGKAQVTIE
jgi:hypothetical protein